MMKQGVIFTKEMIVRVDLIGYARINGKQIVIDVPGSPTLTISCDDYASAQSIFRQIKEKMVEVVS